MANMTLSLNTSEVDEALFSMREGIEYEHGTEITMSTYALIIQKALSLTEHKLTDWVTAQRNGYGDELDALMAAWHEYVNAVVRHAADEVLGE